MKQPTARPRRKQAERRAATRKRLIDATIKSLALAGYHGTTVKEICRLAELSQGALFGIFESRAALITSTLQEINQRTLKSFVTGFEPQTNLEQLIDSVLKLIEDTAKLPESHARREIWNALRTDSKLRESLTNVELFDRTHEQELIRSAMAKVPGLQIEPDTVISALRLAFRYFESLAAISPILDVEDEVASVRSLLHKLAAQQLGIGEPEASKKAGISSKKKRSH